MSTDDAPERRDADQPPPPPPDALDATRPDRGVSPNRWVIRVVVLLVAVLVAWIGLQIAAAFFPRWWAQRVGEQVNGRFVAGTTWGLFYGFVFTFVPLLLLFQIRRRFFSWAWRGVVVVIAVLLAAPNWLTLSIVVGNSSAAHAGERILDVDAPNFRAASLIAAVVAAVIAIAMTSTSMWLKHRKKQLVRVRGERDDLRAREAARDVERSGAEEPEES